MVYGLHAGGNLAHIPKDGFQSVHSVRGQRGHVHAVRAHGSLAGEHRRHFPPVRAGALNVNVVIVPGLQQGQLIRQFYIDPRDCGVQRDGSGRRLVGKEQAEGRGDHGGDQEDHAEGGGEGSPAYQGGEGADQGLHRLGGDCGRLPGEVRDGPGRLFRALGHGPLGLRFRLLAHPLREALCGSFLSCGSGRFRRDQPTPGGLFHAPACPGSNRPVLGLLFQNGGGPGALLD